LVPPVSGVDAVRASTASSFQTMKSLSASSAAVEMPSCVSTFWVSRKVSTSYRGACSVLPSLAVMTTRRALPRMPGYFALPKVQDALTPPEPRRKKCTVFA
jgi:hypothetical protein